MSSTALIRPPNALLESHHNGVWNESLRAELNVRASN